jgi:hypothetical protein
MIPWIKLVGVSGGLAMGNAGRRDDIDLFIITSKRRLWISRILILGILEVLAQRRKKTDSKKQAAGKICCNILLEEDKLAQQYQDLYTAHEVLQMRVLWQRGLVYQKFLEENSWAFEYLPNWIGEVSQKSKAKSQKFNLKIKIVDYLENLAKGLQIKLMGNPNGQERIQNGAVYFHPEDYRTRTLEQYKLRIKDL